MQDTAPHLWNQRCRTWKSPLQAPDHLVLARLEGNLPHQHTTRARKHTDRCRSPKELLLPCLQIVKLSQASWLMIHKAVLPSPRPRPDFFCRKQLQRKHIASRLRSRPGCRSQRQCSWRTHELSTVFGIPQRKHWNLCQQARTTLVCQLRTLPVSFHKLLESLQCIEMCSKFLSSHEEIALEANLRCFLLREDGSIFWDGWNHGPCELHVTKLQAKFLVKLSNSCAECC